MLKKVATEIIHRFKTKYLNQARMIGRSYPCKAETIYSDFDDILPFLLYFGEDEFIREQIELSTQTTFKSLVVFNNKVVSWRNDEYLGALCCYYRKHRCPKVRKIIDGCAESIEKYLMRDGHIFMFYDLRRKSLPRLYSPWAGGLLEVFLENSDLFPEWKPKALRTINLWLKNYSFRKYSLFVFKSHASSHLFNLVNCNFYFRYPKFHRYVNSSFYYIDRTTLRKAIIESIIYYLLQCPTGFHFQFMKANTNFIFALISAYNLTREEQYRKAIENWIDSVKEKLFRDGLIYGVWYPNGTVTNPTLTESLIMIDVLCDTYNFVSKKAKFLDFAKEIADTWIAQQWPNGLFPSVPGGLRNHIDNQTDFSITLRRVSELRSEGKYCEIGRQCFLSTLKHHQTEDGFVTSVTKGGKIVPETVVDPKYNGLLLKGIINWLEERRKIYEIPELHDMLKDR